MNLASAQNAVRRAALALSSAEGKPEAPKLARSYFAAWDRLLRFYHPLPTPSHAHVPLPPDLAGQLRGLLGYVAVGQIPGPISDAAKGSGRRGVGPIEKGDIEVAVAYIEAAKTGQITDKAPIKTVCEKYGTRRTTVQGWLKKL